MSPLCASHQQQQFSDLPHVDSRHPSDQLAKGSPIRGGSQPEAACLPPAASEGVNSVNGMQHQRPSWGSGYSSTSAAPSTAPSCSTWGSGGTGLALRYDSLGGTSCGSNGGDAAAATTPGGGAWGSSCSSSHRPSIAGSSDGGVGGVGGSMASFGGSSGGLGRPPLPGGSRFGSVSSDAGAVMSRPLSAAAATAVRRPLGVPALDLSLIHGAAEQRTKKKRMKAPLGGLSQELGAAEAPVLMSAALGDQEGAYGTEYLTETAEDLEVGDLEVARWVGGRRLLREGWPGAEWLRPSKARIPGCTQQGDVFRGVAGLSRYGQSHMSTCVTVDYRL